jgi:hypothetical protein
MPFIAKRGTVMATKRKQRTNNELLAASEHLLYELQMLFGTAKLLASMDSSRNEDVETRITYNALLESFAIHVRALLDFLYNDGPLKDDIVASDYFDSGYWFLKRPNKPSLLEKVHKNIINKLVAHLTYFRLNVGREEAWEYGKIANEIAVVFARFRDLVYKGHVSPAFYEFMETLIPSHSFFPGARDSEEQIEGNYYQGGVSVMPDPSTSQQQIAELWSRIWKDQEGE